MKRESGWYRIKYKNYQVDGYGEIEGNYEVVLYNSEHNCFYIPDEYGNTIDVQDEYFAYVDPQMVMTTSGEVIYHNNIEGVEVSLDVSTNDRDSGNRIFGIVNGFSESKGKLVILAEETYRNFTTEGDSERPRNDSESI